MADGACPPCGRPAGSVCDGCLSGSPPPEKLAYDRLRAGGACVRGCVQWRSHWNGCDDKDCQGCKPREARHGRVCDRCHLRLNTWLGDKPGSLAWCYEWLRNDLAPAQVGGFEQFGKKHGKPAPPAAMNLHVYALRAEMEVELGGWLQQLCDSNHLHGPDWYHVRRDGVRSFPRHGAEVRSAQDYLATWLDRIEADESLITDLYESADRLIRQARQIAPWEPKATPLRGLECPSCERDALVRFEGDEHLTCRRCGELVGREKYDRWSALKESEREDVVA